MRILGVANIYNMKKLIFLAIVTLSFHLTMEAQKTSDDALRRKTFDAVWSTVNQKFYDPNFNGVDWNAARKKYEPLAMATGTDEDFYKIVNEMLSLLKVSHLEAGSAAAVEKRFKQKPGFVGLGLREIDGRIMVFRSLADFPAAMAGIRPGSIITAIDGQKPVDIDAAMKALAGAPNTSVKVAYLDGNDTAHEVTIERQPLTDKDKGKIAGLSIYSLFDSKRLENGIGYISFSSFVPFLNDRIAAAFDEFKNAPAIIIDLRGNSGGDDSVAIKIDDRLFEKETQLMLIKTRDGINRDMKARGNKNAYRGKLVILVDEYSGSASEDMTAGLQESGRAFVIGKKTMGEDLDADIKELPDGGILVYPFGLTMTPKDVVIEGRGVIPDKIVELKRADLLAGRDTQLQAAIDYLIKKDN